MDTSFATLLRRYRITAGLTQEELAERASLSRRSISDMERGVPHRPRKDSIDLLARALELPEADRITFVEAAGRLSTSNHQIDSTQPRPHQDIQQRITGGFLGSLPASVLVARHDEMTSMLASVDTVSGGEGRLVMLAGEPGVGKTRLAQELMVALDDRAFLVSTGRCYEPQRTAPFYPFLDLLTTLYELAPSAIQAETLRRWPYLARLLPEQLGLGPLPTSDRPEDQQRLFLTVTGFVKAIAESSLVALLLDDLHWADSASIDLLAHLARHTRDHRVLLLGTFRDIDVRFHSSLQGALHDLGREDLLQVIVLRGLGLDGTTGLMAATMGETEIPAELARLVHHRTEGNAFFVQQVVRDLVERGAVTGTESDWSQGVIEVPESVRVAIGCRLSRLKDETRQVLQQASVLGQTFSFDDLDAMTDRTDEELEVALEEGRWAGLVREGEVDTYAFNHALTQQTLYEELSSRQRRNLHLAAGEALERLPERERERRTAELAWHFGHGHDTERTLTWTVRAGEQAEAVFAYQEAERRYRTALELAQVIADPAREAQTWAHLAGVLKTMARYDEALLALERSAAIYSRQGDIEREVRVVARMGRVHVARGTPDEGLARVQPVVEAVASSGHSVGLSGLYAAMADCYGHLGRHEAELTAAERAVASASAVHDARSLAAAYVVRGGALTFLLRFEEALQALQQAAQLADEIEDLPILHNAHQLMIGLGVIRGRYAEALEAGDRTVEVAERLNDPGLISLAYSSRALTSLMTGEWNQAGADIEHALALGRQIGGWDGTAFALLQRGRLAVYHGEWAEATQSLEECIEMAQVSGNLFHLRWAHAMLAERDVLLGHPEKACERMESLLTGSGEVEDLSITQDVEPVLIWARIEAGEIEQAHEILEQHTLRVEHAGYPSVWSQALWLQAMIATRQARWEEARSTLERGLTLTRRLPNPLMEGRLLTVSGQMLAAQGELEVARERLETAQSIFMRLGARPDAERVERALRGLTQQPGSADE